MPGTRRPPQSLRAASARARREGNGFGHAQVAQIQRARILAAMFDVATELGAASVSVADVVERSGVSRRTFYETFADREDCFLAAFEDALAFASQRVLPAYQAEKKWRERIRAAVIAFLFFLDEEPVIGRLLIRESLTGGAKTRMRREEVLAQLAGAIDMGREESGSAAAMLGPLTAEGLVGGALSILDARLSQPEHAPPVRGTLEVIPKGHIPRGHAAASGLIGLANMLVSMIVLPYLGPAAARKELERPIEPRQSEHRDARLLEDPFKDAGMRLTYRTARVLLAVSEHPGASNRAIGESAGMSDQGQISKLLGRLQRLGLVSNTGLGPGQGAPNAWTLTGTGRQLTKSIRAHTASSQ
jgi:AcrR family transcriptional regulator